MRRGIGSDPRIAITSSILAAATAAPRFPKDVQALQRTGGGDAGMELKVLNAVEAANDAQKHVLANKIKARFGSDLKGRKFALWGLAFKPNTDDMREAPSRYLIADLFEAGATVTAYDPVAMDETSASSATNLVLPMPTIRWPRSMAPTRW